MFGCFLRLFLEGYLELCISAFINFKYLTLDKPGDRFAASCTLILIFIGILLPPFLVLFLLYNHDLLEDPQFKQRYGALYEGIDTTRTTALFYYSAFALRRLLFALTCVYLVDTAVFQI